MFYNIGPGEILLTCSLIKSYVHKREVIWGMYYKSFAFVINAIL